MYIRRKVFSLLEDEMGEERYFSTTDFELTDDVEERYYSNDEDNKGMSKAAKVALGTGSGLAAVAGGIYGAKKGAFGKTAGKAVNDVIMRGAKKVGARKVFEDAAEDYAIQAVRKADKVGSTKKMDAAGKRAFLKRVAETKKKFMDAFDVDQAAKGAKKETKKLNKTKALPQK